MSQTYPSAQAGGALTSYEWEPERVVDRVTACALLESCFPELGNVHAVPYGAGWDNTVYLINGRLVFRFPRRQISLPGIELEGKVLKEIAEALPLAVPVPRYFWTGDARLSYPWPFIGYRLIRGV